MFFKKLIQRIPPNISTKIVSGVLALFIALSAVKCFQLISAGKRLEDNKNEDNSEPENSDTDNDIPVSTTPSESADVIKTTNTKSVTYGVSAEGAVLYNLDKNEIACEKNMKYQLACGDISIFAAAILIADKLESGEISAEDKVVCPASAARRPNYTLSEAIYSVGTNLNVETLLKCMLYQRGSGFAYSLAVHVSGSEELFVKEMNLLAEKLGAASTVFTNVCGQDDGISKTTAYDTAIIIKAFFERQMLSDIFRSHEGVTVRKNGAQSSVYLTVKNDFFEINCSENQAKTDGILGGKTGYCGYLGWSVVLFNDGAYRYAAIVISGPSAFSDAMQIFSQREYQGS